MKLLGTAAALQIQRSPLKSSVNGVKTYHPERIARVERLWVLETGVIGIAADGTHLIDVHNALHTRTRHRGGNGLSLGITAHYAHMRAEFGSHIQDGSAGENIILACEDAPLIDALGESVVVEKADGTCLTFKVVSAIAPCDPFARFCLGTPTDPLETKSALQFLMDGRRGFLIEFTGVGQPVIDLGDRFFAEVGY